MSETGYHKHRKLRDVSNNDAMSSKDSRFHHWRNIRSTENDDDIRMREGVLISPDDDVGNDVRGGDEGTQDNTMLESSAAIPSDGVGFWLLLGTCVGSALLCVALIVLAYRRFARNKRKASLDSLDSLDLDLNNTSKSAPCTRATTPQIRRKESMPETTSMRAHLIRSVTVDTVPDFRLPPERVQPDDMFSRMRSDSTPQYQQDFLASFQPQLYSSLVDDDETERTGNGDDGTVSGSVWFSVLYDAAVEQLTVTLVKAKHLKGRGRSNGARDPFVKLYLLPDERSCQQTRVRKKTCNPKFNESFVFNVEASEVVTRTLRMSVYDVDKRRVRHSLGHVILSLSEVDLASGELMVKPLENMAQTNTAGLGEICLSLNWNPSSERIQITVVTARNLNKLDYDTQDGVYVRAQYISGGKVQKTKKTGRVTAGCDPSFNEMVSFSLPNKQLEAVSFCVTLLSSKPDGVLGPDLEYGKVVLGSYIHTRGEGLLHWQEMMSQARVSVSRWHHLSQTPTPDSKGHFSS